MLTLPLITPPPPRLEHEESQLKRELADDPRLAEASLLPLLRFAAPEATKLTRLFRPASCEHSEWKRTIKTHAQPLAWCLLYTEVLMTS